MLEVLLNNTYLYN